MDQVALGLQLARPPEIIRRNRRRTERIVAVHQFMGTNYFSVFERERVERSHELLRRHDEGRRQLRPAPPPRELRARLQILRTQAADERETGEWRIGCALH